MNRQPTRFAAWFVTLAITACADRSSPEPIAAPSFAAGDVGRPAVLVNPALRGDAIAGTIQEGIDMVAEGGRVLVAPGMYAESLVIRKGLTLDAIGGASGPVIVARQPDTQAVAILVETPDPVVIRGLTVEYTSAS